MGAPSYTRRTARPLRDAVHRVGRGTQISYIGLLLAVVIGILHAAVAPVIAIGDVHPNLVLVAVVAVTVMKGFGPGVAWAFAAGLTANLLTREPLGSIPLGLLVVAAATSGGARLFGRLSWAYPVAAVALGSIVVDAISLGVLLMVDPSTSRGPSRAAHRGRRPAQRGHRRHRHPARPRPDRAGRHRREAGVVSVAVTDLDGAPPPLRSRARFVAASVVAVLLFGVLGGRLFQLQVIDGARYAARAAAARTVEVPIRAPRGLIFDREGRPIAVNTPSWTLYARPADLPKARSRALGRAATARRSWPESTSRSSRSGWPRSAARRSSSCRWPRGSAARPRC